MNNCSQYIVRFDDICPTMNWRMWEEIEPILLHFGVRPILSVVPENCDVKLCIDVPRKDFWHRIRRWQALGWTIALHGHQHVYRTKRRGIIGFLPQSEFAGLDSEEQERKLRLATDTFSREGVIPQAWVAPSHSFDWTTVRILTKMGIRVISDGLWHWPHFDENGVAWIPQQLWHLRSMPPGIWTVCLHHNDWNETMLEHFGKNIQLYAPSIVSVENVLVRFAGRRLNNFDRFDSIRRRVRDHWIPPWASRLRHLFSTI